MAVNIGVPSRFSCLKIEDDDSARTQNRPKEVKKKADKKPDSKKIVRDVKTEKIVGSKKATANKQVAKKDKKKPNTQQWEDWKEKDAEYVNGNFEDDLETAILQSKLEYEHQQLSSKDQQDGEKEKNGAQNKKKKNKSMSLDQFLHPAKDDEAVIGDQKAQLSSTDERFFETVQLDAKKELSKEQVKENRKKRDANIDEIVCQAQYQEKLQHEKSLVATLESELGKYKNEIKTVKQRNQTLCNLLSNGEMKDKAGVLEEIEKISVDKNELIKEVSRLHIENEQLRSKLAVYEAQNNKHKEKKRKQKGA